MVACWYKVGLIENKPKIETNGCERGVEWVSTRFRSCLDSKEDWHVSREV